MPVSLRAAAFLAQAMVAPPCHTDAAAGARYRSGQFAGDLSEPVLSRHSIPSSWGGLQQPMNHSEGDRSRSRRWVATTKPRHALLHAAQARTCAPPDTHEA
ncbi:hypothetical protein Pden_5024 (plasmid) [Paracoccus denitrificans PD1222]|jgi:hypothetical protein|uniref:Uncharacterized protein n=1 Tax=Paracoccus denitrificans (strain Pd 1222) TaxID=318586 RepID=A1BC40_PARDP|nr:hypothetical protein Pden_5024 [Paracoccus denitrificans PD1222]